MKKPKLIYNEALNTYATELKDKRVIDRLEQDEELEHSGNLEHTDTEPAVEIFVHGDK